MSRLRHYEKKNFVLAYGVSTEKVNIFVGYLCLVYMIFVLLLHDICASFTRYLCLAYMIFVLSLHDICA